MTACDSPKNIFYKIFYLVKVTFSWIKLKIIFINQLFAKTQALKSLSTPIGVRFECKIKHPNYTPMGSVWGHQANLISSPLSHPKCMHSGLDLNESPFIFDTKEGVCKSIGMR